MLLIFHCIRLSHFIDFLINVIYGDVFKSEFVDQARYAYIMNQFFGQPSLKSDKRRYGTHGNTVLIYIRASSAYIIKLVDHILFFKDIADDLIRSIA